MSIKDQVKQNLLYYNLWTQVTEVELPSSTLLKGIPKEPLLNDETHDIPTQELVFPVSIEEKVTPRRLETVFNEMQSHSGTRPKRIVIGIVNDDSTVVYYFIHDGVYKPKKN